MNTPALIVPQIEIPLSALPPWEQFSVEHQEELVRALAAVLLHLPQLQALEEKMVAQGAGDERQS
jgi:hypothetical protein